MNETMCVDASLVVALLLPERLTDMATTMWEAWVKQENRILAPSLMGYEVTSAIYRKVLQGTIAPLDGEAALHLFLALDIDLRYFPELHEVATQLAGKFKRPNTYDAHYMALAKYLSIPLWTTDERLYNSVKHGFPLIHLVGT